MSVKGIFKTLIGVVVLIVVSSLIIEMINITISALEINQISRIAARQAAVLFSQETYKSRDGDSSGTVGMQNSVAKDGSIYVSGEFYTGTSPEEIYKDLYENSSEFKDWAAHYESNWNNVRLINLGLQGIDINSISIPSGDASPDEFKQYTDLLIANSYRQTLVTPLNMGVPYLDKDTVERIFRWNLAQMASDCNQDMIRNDPDSTHTGNYVYYNGFRLWASEATITNIEYQVFDITNSSDLDKFKRITHINDVENLGYLDGIDIAEEILGVGAEERSKICVVGIEFKVPISYEGITPLRKIVEFIWNYDVQGFTDAAEGSNHTPRTNTNSWTDEKVDLESGGMNGSNRSDGGTLPVPGKLIYYIVR